MNEPKKALLESAARGRWPDAIGFRINHRKHTLEVQYKDRIHNFTLSARTHRELLKVLVG